MTDRIREFLNESNAIEGVYGEDSLLQAEYAWAYLISQEEMNPSVILKTHKILMLHQPLHPHEKGYFRTEPVYVGGREGVEHSLIEKSVQSLTQDMQLDPEDWKAHHIRYEKIHPFIDGNGRTGRMFMNLERLRAGLPILVITELERFEYYKWFK